MEISFSIFSQKHTIPKKAGFPEKRAVKFFYDQSKIKVRNVSFPSIYNLGVCSMGALKSCNCGSRRPTNNDLGPLKTHKKAQSAITLFL